MCKHSKIQHATDHYGTSKFLLIVGRISKWITLKHEFIVGYVDDFIAVYVDDLFWLYADYTNSGKLMILLVIIPGDHIPAAVMVDN